MLEEERTFIKENEAEWLRRNRGQYALVKGRELCGVYESPHQAYDIGIVQFGRPFLIVPIDSPKLEGD
ncbi:MAG: hypothetical protein V3R94_07205 [Acidobacteriota bacterium]